MATASLRICLGAALGIAAVKPACTVPIRESLTTPPHVRLLINVSGTGEVSIEPSGETCSDRCTIDLAHGATVSLRPTALHGARFEKWSDRPCRHAHECHLEIRQSLEVNAVFSYSPYRAEWWTSLETREGLIADVFSVGLDGRGNVVVGGAFSKELMIAGGVETLRSVGDLDAYVVKVAGTNGDLLWARAIGGPGHERTSRLVPTGNSDVVALVNYGYYARGWDLGGQWLGAPGGNVVVRLAGPDGAILFVHGMLEREASGATHWDAGGLILVGHDWAANVEFPMEAVLLSEERGIRGTRSLTSVKSPGDSLHYGNTLIVAGLSWDRRDIQRVRPQDRYMTLTALSAVDGSSVWIRQFQYNGTGSYAIPTRLAATPEGLVLVGGVFQGQLAVDGHEIESAGARDIFLAAISPEDGTCQWLRQIGGPGNEGLSSLASSSRGLVVLGWTDSKFEHDGIVVGTRQRRARSRSFLMEFDHGGARPRLILNDLDLLSGHVEVDHDDNLILVGDFRRRGEEGPDVFGVRIPASGQIAVLKLVPLPAPPRRD